MSTATDTRTARTGLAVLALLLPPLGMLRQGRPGWALVYLLLIFVLVAASLHPALGSVAGAAVLVVAPLAAMHALRIAPPSPRPGYASVNALIGFGIALLSAIWLLLRLFVVDFYRVPSESMAPTLLPGSVIVVDKRVGLALTLSRLLPVEGADPVSIRRGDVLLFTRPEGGAPYVARAVGLGGDLIDFAEKRLQLNGAMVTSELPKTYAESIEVDEKLDGRTHRVRFRPLGLVRTGGATTVPAEHLFMLGDNRDNSLDSRQWGPLPLEHVRGRVVANFGGSFER